MKKLVWAVLCISTFSTCAAIAEDAVAPATQPAPGAPMDQTAAPVAEDTAAEGLTTAEMVIVGAAVVGAAAIASNSDNSSTSHHGSTPNH